MAVEPIDFLKNNSADTNRQFSPAIWADCPWNSIVDGSIPGLLFYDDFQDFPLIATQTTEINHGKYKIFATASCSVSRVSAVNSVEIAGGALSTSLAATANSATLAQSYPSYLLSGLTATSGKLWFEACVAVDVVTANAHGFFVGLAEVEQWTLATGVPFSSNTGLAITSGASAVGFNLPCNGLGQVKTVYSDRATSFTAVGATDPSVMTAFAFTKLGMSYDPKRTGSSSSQPNTCAIQFFQDNVMLPTGITSAALIALTNLDANAVGLIFATIAGSSVSTGLSFMKYWRCAQLLPA